ncbi:MAG: MFS transporter [Erysipelotrichales bacterium]
MIKWFKFALIYFGAFVISISQFKIAPPAINNMLVENLGVASSSIQLLSSIFAISGIFLAIPGGAIMSKVGPKKLAVSLMGCLALGNIIGYFSTDNYTLLVVTRILEGISFAMFLMIAMVYIRKWFADGGSGLALGIFGTYSALAQPIIIGSSQPIVDKIGYQSIWLIIGVLALLTMLIYIFALENIQSQDKKEANIVTENYFKEAFANKQIWFLALCHGCMTFSLFTYLNFGPKILEVYFGASNIQVTSYMSLFGIAGIIIGILAGILVDKTKRPMEIGIIAFTAMSIYWISQIVQGTATPTLIITIFVCILSSVTGIAYTCVMILASGISKKPEVTGYNISIVNTVYYAVIVVGAPLAAQIVEKFSWNAMFIFFTIISIIGVLSMVLFRTQNKNIKVL